MGSLMVPHFSYFDEERIPNLDYGQIVQLIGAVGFPIVACVAMAWFYATQFKQLEQLIIKNNLLTQELINLLKDTK